MRACELVEMPESHAECVRLESPVHVFTEISYRCYYMQGFFLFLKYKYNVKACMYTISSLYEIINLNVST